MELVLPCNVKRKRWRWVLVFRPVRLVYAARFICTTPPPQRTLAFVFEFLVKLCSGEKPVPTRCFPHVVLQHAGDSIQLYLLQNKNHTMHWLSSSIHAPVTLTQYHACFKFSIMIHTAWQGKQRKNGSTGKEMVTSNMDHCLAHYSTFASASFPSNPTFTTFHLLHDVKDAYICLLLLLKSSIICKFEASMTSFCRSVV